MKVAPRPGALLTFTVPPWPVTRVRTIHNPSPSPPNERGGTARCQRSKMMRWSRWAIPIP